MVKSYAQSLINQLTNLNSQETSLKEWSLKLFLNSNSDRKEKKSNSMIKYCLRINYLIVTLISQLPNLLWLIVLLLNSQKTLKSHIQLQKSEKLIGKVKDMSHIYLIIMIQHFKSFFTPPMSQNTTQNTS